jgi:hypothetical protein
MVDGCADWFVMDEDGTVLHQETQTPFTGIAITYRAGDQVEVLATVDADEHGRFEVVVDLPTDAPPGTAELHAGPDWVEPALLEVTPG